MKDSRLIYGVGINDLDSISVNRKPISAYQCWMSMLQRCYDEKYQTKQPTYVGCTVSDEWLLLSNFKQFYDINYVEGFQIDKDILVRFNKIYSKDTCCFVPKYLNCLLTDRSNARGDLPLGVSALKPNNRGRLNTSYLAKCNNGNGTPITKTFKTIHEAVEWYSVTKTRIVREVATKAIEAGHINQKIFDALTSRQY